MFFVKILFVLLYTKFNQNLELTQKFMYYFKYRHNLLFHQEEKLLI